MDHELIDEYVNKGAVHTRVFEELSSQVAKKLDAESVIVCEASPHTVIWKDDVAALRSTVLLDINMIGAHNASASIQTKFIDNCRDVIRSGKEKREVVVGMAAIKNYAAVPLRDMKQLAEDEVLGVLLVVNFDETKVHAGTTVESTVFPLIEVIRTVLSSNVHNRMHKLLASVVNQMGVPTIMFQRRRQPATTTSTTTALGEYYCLMHNQAFVDVVLKNKLSQIIGAGFEQCFPQLRKNAQLIDPLLEMVSASASPKPTASFVIEAVVHEDLFIDKDTYTITFSKVDDHDGDTFIFSIDSVSEQLRAKIMASEIAQAKEQFVANVSHEIRTPLNGILGYIAMMTDDSDDTTSKGALTDYQQNCLQQIKDCSMNLLYIMNDILDFSKLNADQMQLHEDAFDLSELLEKSYDVILPGAQEKGIEGAFLIDPNVPPRVKGDFKKMRQILLNLLSNGVKFTHRGRIDTTVKIVKDDVTGADLDVRGRYTLEFCVQDTGIGIAKSDQQKLFVPFSQIDQSDRKIYQGTGLGLIISKKLVELMGGRIWVESDEGEGSQFFFTVKLEEVRQSSPETRSRWLPLLKDRCVLVVDDHATNRITISSNLLRWGMKPVICGSPEEALLYLRGGVMEFDIALIDMRMPKMDGNALAAKIHMICPNLRLVAISSSSNGPKEPNKAFSFYLSKPIKLRQLFNVCVSLIKRKIKEEEPQLSPPASSSNASSSAASASNNHKSPPLSSTDSRRSPTDTRRSPKHKRGGSATAMSPHPSPVLPRKNKSNESPVAPPHCERLGRSFLIAEDLVTNQRVATGFLKKLGFTDFTIAEDGIAALEAVKKRHFDVVLMDLKMPKMDGFETTERIRKYYRQNKGLIAPKIVALTANAMGGIKEKCREVGMDAYLTKPIDIHALAQILNDL